MIRTLGKNWWLLAAGGVLNAAIAAIYLVMQGTGGPVLAGSWSGTVVLAGILAAAAGVCAMAAALWRSKTGRSWGLAVNGLALAVLGVIQYGLIRLRIDILIFAVLVIAMAVSIGTVELAVARGLRRRRLVAEAWFFGVVGTLSVSLVLPSLALGLRWVRLERGSHADLLWLAAYFGLAAVGTIALAVEARAAASAQGLGV